MNEPAAIRNFNAVQTHNLPNGLRAHTHERRPDEESGTETCLRWQEKHLNFYWREKRPISATIKTERKSYESVLSTEIIVSEGASGYGWRAAACVRVSTRVMERGAVPSTCASTQTIIIEMKLILARRAPEYLCTWFHCSLSRIFCSLFLSAPRRAEPIKTLVGCSQSEAATQIVRKMRATMNRGDKRTQSCKEK